MMITVAFIGFSECLFIFIIAFIILGPEKMPEIARKTGRMVRELKKGYADFQNTFQDDIDQVKNSAAVKNLHDIHEEYHKIKTMSRRTMSDMYHMSQEPSLNQESELRTSSERKDDEE